MDTKHQSSKFFQALERQTQELEDPSSGIQTSETQRATHVLVVEDHPLVLKVISKTLSQNYYTHVEHPNEELFIRSKIFSLRDTSHSALEYFAQYLALANSLPQLIFLDNNLKPSVDGFDVKGADLVIVIRAIEELLNINMRCTIAIISDEKSAMLQTVTSSVHAQYTHYISADTTNADTQIFSMIKFVLEVSGHDEMDDGEIRAYLARRLSPHINDTSITAKSEAKTIVINLVTEYQEAHFSKVEAFDGLAFDSFGSFDSDNDDNDSSKTASSLLSFGPSK